MPNSDYALLGGANFSEARLMRTSLRSANLREAHLLEVSMDRCDFAGAVLREARLLQAKVFDCNFTEARAGGSQFLPQRVPVLQAAGNIRRRIELGHRDACRIANSGRADLASARLRSGRPAPKLLLEGYAPRRQLSERPPERHRSGRRRSVRRTFPRRRHHDRKSFAGPICAPRKGSRRPNSAKRVRIAIPSCRMVRTAPSCWGRGAPALPRSIAA